MARKSDIEKYSIHSKGKLLLLKDSLEPKKLNKYK